MFNYLIKIEYEGTNFVGWQSQKNGKSVQDNIEKALKKVLGIKINIIGAGRTDKGVHAYGQSANFFCDKEIKDKYKFLSSVNFFLKKNLISIINLTKKRLNFHARHNVKKKIYKYIIFNRLTSSPLHQNRSWVIKKKLNFNNMKKGIKYFVGLHDFSSMRASSCSAKNPERTIIKAQVRKKKNKIIVNFESKSFLQKQVRSMVGCLKYVGENKWKPERIKFVLKSRKRELCAPPAPPDGLYLEKVFY